jgi:hypothetical protein
MHAILAPVRALAPASARRVTPTARSQRRRAAVGRTAANAGPIVALGASVSAGDANVVDAKHARAVSEVAARSRTEEEGAALATRVGEEEEEELDATELDATAAAATALFAAFAFAFFAGVDPAIAADSLDVDAPREVFSLAGGEVPFWANMVKYARFSISIMVGFAFMFGRPVVAALKKPQTAILVVGGGYGAVRFFQWTIETMSGVNDPMTMTY